MEGTTMTTFDLSTGSSLPMIAMAPESIGNRYVGQKLDNWLRRRGCDQRTVNRITARRFTYGSYRPSDRAAMLLDSSPELTPYAEIAAD
jgi:hypothetical protein